MTALRIDTVRGRLTAFYITALAAALIIVGGLIYVLLARALYARIDDSLYALVQIATTSLTNDLAEGQDEADAARSTAAELSSRQQMLAIYDDAGRLLAEGGRDDDLHDRAAGAGHDPDRRRHRSRPSSRRRTRTTGTGLRSAASSSLRTDARYIVVAGSSLEPTDEELESLREILAYVVPIALMLAGIGGWFLARQSLSPVAAMVERARKMSAEDLSGRLPVANPRDELGRLAETFNDLLGRLEASITTQRQLTATQRQFMADASHELRTPVDDHAHRRERRVAAAASRRTRVSRHARHHRAAGDEAVTHRRRHVYAGACGRGHLSGPADADVSRRSRG